jgi:hypothetical protein
MADSGSNIKLRSSVTQLYDAGCSYACFAFVTGLTYTETIHFMGAEQSAKTIFMVGDFCAKLNQFGLKYRHKHIKDKNSPFFKGLLQQEGSIVIIARSKLHPTGHYLARHKGYWMDPWINLATQKDITKARSGYRKRLPSRPMYVIYPDKTT